MGEPRYTMTICTLEWWDEELSVWRGHAMGSEASMREAYTALIGMHECRPGVKWRLSWFRWTGSEDLHELQV